MAEGAEFEGATLTASFTAPHMQDITARRLIFYDTYSLAGTGLEDLLPNDDYDNAAAQAYVPEGCSPGPVYTAGANGTVAANAPADHPVRHGVRGFQRSTTISKPASRASPAST